MISFYSYFIFFVVMITCSLLLVLLLTCLVFFFFLQYLALLLLCVFCKILQYDRILCSVIAFFFFSLLQTWVDVIIPQPRSICLYLFSPFMGISFCFPLFVFFFIIVVCFALRISFHCYYLLFLCLASLFYFSYPLFIVCSCPRFIFLFLCSLLLPHCCYFCR